MVEMDRNRRVSDKVLLATAIGLVLSVVYLVLKTQVDIHKVVLVLSPILAIVGALLAGLVVEKGKTLGSLLVGLAVLSLVLTGTGLLPRLLDWKDHTGIFLKPGDNLYEKRFISSTDSSILSKLDPNSRFYANQLYSREAIVSQTLPKHFWVDDLSRRPFEHRKKESHYYIVSTNRNGESHYQSLVREEVLVIDTEGLKVWEYKDVERIHED